MIFQRPIQQAGFAWDSMVSHASAHGNVSDYTGSFPSYGLSSPALSDPAFSSFGTTPEDDFLLFPQAGIRGHSNETFPMDVASWTEESYNLGDRSVLPAPSIAGGDPGQSFQFNSIPVPMSIDDSEISYTCNDQICKTPNRVFASKTDLE